MSDRETPPRERIEDPSIIRTDAYRGAPAIEGFAPAEGPPGTLIEIVGENLQGSRFRIGRARARVVEHIRDGVVVEVPEITGTHPIVASNVFGQAVAHAPFRITIGGGGYTFRGDAISAGGPGHSLTPTGKDQPVLVLLCRTSDMVLPPGTTEASLVGQMKSKVDGSTNSVNSYWKEASYGKTSFTFDVHSKIIAMPSSFFSYFHGARAKKVTGAGAAYPITWTGGETLALSGEGSFTATVTFAAGSQSLAAVVQTVNNAIVAAATDPTKPPIIARVEGGQLQLRSAKLAASAVLDVTGGTARTALGLAAGTAVVEAGIDFLDRDVEFIADALTARTASMSTTQKKAFLAKYDAVVAAVVADSTSILRAEGNPGWSFTIAPKIQFKASWVTLTTAYPWEVLAHEFGHMLGFPDVYDESGLQAGTEPANWDIMDCSWCDAHPTSWFKHQRSRGTGYKGTPWMQDADVEEITAPSQTKTWSVLLTPVERPVPKSNPYSTSHPGIPMRHAIRIKLSPELSYYVENRQTPFTSSTFGTSRYDGDIPATGVIVTDAADRDSSKLFRVFVTLATGYNDPLDTKGETWTYYVNATKRIEVKVVEAIGSSPTVYRVDVTWGDVPPATGTDFDFRIRDWTPPPWESPDIWVDTKVDNAWDVYKHSDSTKNPFVTGHPVLNGDRLRAKWASRLYARVWNDGNVAKNDVVVKFQVVLPVAMGPSPGMDIGERKVNLPAGGSAVTPALTWAPMDVKDEHLCIRAFVVPDPKEKSHQNNSGQENFADWYVEKSSPYRPIRFPFQVTNPLSRRALILMHARGLVPGFNLTVEPYQFWLDEGETIHGEAQLDVEDWVMTEDAMNAEEQQAPVVSLEAMVKRGCTYVPFGGVSGIAHTVRRAELDMELDAGEEAVYVSGTARTADGPIAGARVAVRIVGRDQTEELAFATALTAADGSYSEQLTVHGGGPDDERFIEAVLAPTPGTGPAAVEASPIPLP